MILRYFGKYYMIEYFGKGSLADYCKYPIFFTYV